MKWLCLLLLSSCLYTQASAQQTVVKKYTRTFNSSSVIHDSAGNIIPYSTWSPLMATGDYVIAIPHGMSPDSNYFVLRHFSRQEKERSARVMTPNPSPNFPDGQPVDFAGKSIDGRSYNTRELKGKIVVLHISFLLRYPGEELSSYNELIDSFGTSGKLVFLCITPVNKADTKALLKDVHTRYAVIAGQQKFLDGAGVHIYPQDIVLDQEGKVTYSSTGNGNSTVIWLEKKIKTLLAVP